jgi:hypothetical protein
MVIADFRLPIENFALQALYGNFRATTNPNITVNRQFAIGNSGSVAEVPHSGKEHG